MSVRAVIFDKDGTLIDFNETWGRAAYHVFSDLSEGDEARFDALVSVARYDPVTRCFAPESNVFTDATSVYGPSWAKAARAEEGPAFNAHIDVLFQRHSIAYVTPFADTVATLTAFAAAGITMGCVTNDAEACAREQLGSVGMTSHFVEIIGYDSGYGRKPEPGQILAFAEKTGLRPEEMAFVGDSTHDLHAARAAGCMAIGVTTGAQDAAVLGPHADHVMSRLGELTALLLEI
ncbi:MAG: HAD family hydrolase [Hyphomicrobiales bacterium]|nr:MAG: HAD family hydrolase [Hyphomicrobiales bacterium]